MSVSGVVDSVTECVTLTMLKLLSSSSARQFHTHSPSHSLRVTTDSSTNPLLQQLSFITGLARRKSSNAGFHPRANFYSNSSGNGISKEVQVELKSAELADDRAYASNATVPTSPRPEDYLTVLAVPLPHRPLFPGFCMPIYVKDPKLLVALQESQKRNALYCGAFLRKYELGTDPSMATDSESEKNIYDLKGKDLFNRLHEVGTLAQITRIQGDQVILIGLRLVQITAMVNEDPLTIKAYHLKEKPCDKDDDVIKATSFEVISTLRDVKAEVEFKWKFLPSIIFSENKVALRQFSSSCIDIPTIVDLVAKQHWSKLKTLLWNTDHDTVLHQLLTLGSDPELTLRYFTWSQKEFKLSQSLEITFKILHSLAFVKKYSKIRSFLDKFVKKEKKYLVTSIFHAISVSGGLFCANSLIADMLLLAYVNNNKSHLGFEAFKRAGDYGFKLSVVSCNPLLSALVKRREIGNMEFVFKEMIKRRIAPSLISFNTVINGLCKVGKLNKATDVIEDMKLWGVPANVITYNTVIDGYCKTGKIGKMYQADAVLKKMVANGIFPNEVTFNILIDGFCKDQNIPTAMKEFAEMQRQGLKPNVVTYNTLINGLCCDGKVDEAVSLWGQMIGLGLKPNIVTFNALINGFCKNKMVKKAVESYDDMSKQGISPDVTTYNTLIDSYCKAERMEDAFALWNVMSSKGVCPNISTYNCLIAGFCRKGDTEAAMNLVHELSSKGLRADVVTYNILIDAFCNRGESKKAMKILDEMLRKGVDPSHISYNTLIDGYCKERNLRAALNLRTKMEKQGKRVNIVTYNVLIKGFCKKGQLEDANGLLNELLEKGLIPNRITYEIVREEMLEKGFVPDIEGHIYNVSVNS